MQTGDVLVHAGAECLLQLAKMRSNTEASFAFDGNILRSLFRITVLCVF